MTYSYYDLFPSDQAAYGRDHKLAQWGLCGAGDMVKLPNIFSYRVVYFNSIMKDAKERANQIGAFLNIFQSNDFINFEFRKVEEVGGPAPHYTKTFNGGENFMSLAPEHCGTEVTMLEVNNRQGQLRRFGYIGSIDFYPIGSPQDEE